MKHHPLAAGQSKNFKTILSEKLLWVFFERGLYNWRRSVPRINWEKFETQHTELFIIGKNTHSVFFWQTGGGAETFRSHFEISFFCSWQRCPSCWRLFQQVPYCRLHEIHLDINIWWIYYIYPSMFPSLILRHDSFRNWRRTKWK